MAAPVVHYEITRGVATLTLDSPSNRNALSARLVGELMGHLERAKFDPTVRAVVLSHTGSVFCAGADLKERSAASDQQAITNRTLTLFRTVLEMPKPVIARIAGACRAGGLGVIGACDLAIANRDASFAFSEVRRGLAPALISLVTLPRMTQRSASHYFLTGQVFDATVAARCGLITNAVDDLDGEMSRIEEALRQGSPQGLTEAKRLATRSVLDRIALHGEEMRDLSARLFASSEAREGMEAFLQRRAPSWAGAASD